MPIQWIGILSSPSELASIIQGEASTAEGQFAVASVMYNRLQSGQFGSSISSVVTPTNFNGFNPNPSSNAQQLADALWAGQAPPGGTTGNALYFAAPSPANAAWANPNTAQGAEFFQTATPVGGNYYSDQLGAPSANFQAPSFDGAQATGTSGGSVGFLDSGFPGANAGGSGGASLEAGTNSTDGAFNFDGPAETSGPIGSGQIGPVTGDQGLASALGTNISPGTVSTASPSFEGGGPPLEITNISSAGSQAAQTVGQSVQNASSQVSKAVTSSTQTGVLAATNLIGSLETTATDLTVRGALILLALVILAGAWVFYSADNRGKINISLAKI